MKNLKKLSEKDLLKRAVGDEEAFHELYQRYHQLVYFVAYKLCKNDADAQDVVQETFIEIKRSVHNLKNPQYFRLWLYRIIDSKCKKLFRKNKFPAMDIEQDHLQNTFQVQNVQEMPDDAFHYKNDQELLQSMILDLPYDQKLAVLLYYMEQKTTLEIAQLLDVPEGTIKSRLSNARATLKRKIEAYEHREGVELNFHDLSAALYTSFALVAPAILPSMQPSASFTSVKHVVHAIKTSAIGMNIAIGTCVSVIAASLGYAAYQSSQPKPNTNLVQPIAKGTSSTFPVVQFRGEEIKTSMDAYYTLKSNVCKQDIETLSLEEWQEVDRLYQAIKAENGVFYQRLIDTGWQESYENNKK